MISEGSGACVSPFKYNEKDTVVSGVDEVGPPRPEKLWRNFNPSGQTLNQSGGPVPDSWFKDSIISWSK